MCLQCDWKVDKVITVFMNLGVIIPIVQALVTCQLQGEHLSQFFFNGDMI